MPQSEADGGRLGPHPIASHDRLDVGVLDLYIRPHRAHTPIIHHVDWPISRIVSDNELQTWPVACRIPSPRSVSDQARAIPLLGPTPSSWISPLVRRRVSRREIWPGSAMPEASATWRLEDPGARAIDVSTRAVRAVGRIGRSLKGSASSLRTRIGSTWMFRSSSRRAAADPR